MPFNQQPVNYAAQYGRELSNAYPYLSHYGDLWNQGEGQRFRPLRGKTVYIPSMTTSGAKAANRDQITGVFNRNFNVDWQAVTLNMDREWDTLVDPLDIMETDEVATIANVTRTFNQTQKIPEQDSYMSQKLASFAVGYGGIDSTTLTAANILSQWDAYLAEMVNQRVDRRNLRAKLTPTAYKLLKQAAGITRFIAAEGGHQSVDRNIAVLDGVGVQEVPEEMMKTAYTYTEGWAVDAGANQINLVLYDSSAIAAPIVYDTAMMSAPTAQSKGKHLYYERYYYDVFSLRQRQAGIFANISGSQTLGALAVASAAGSAAGSTVITVTGKQIRTTGEPAHGLDLYYLSGTNAATSLTYGAALPSGTWVKAGGSPIVLTSQTAGKYITVALVNHQNEKVVAGGNAVLVVGS